MEIIDMNLGGMVSMKNKFYVVFLLIFFITSCKKAQDIILKDYIVNNEFMDENEDGISGFLKEKISKVQIPALLLCFCGAVIAFCPKFGDGISPALLCAVLDAVFSGVAYTTLSALGGKAHPLTVVFYFSVFSCLSAGFLMIPQYVQPTANELYLLVLIGVTAAVGQIGLTYACQLSSAAQMSIYSYVSIPVSMLFGLLFFQEKITVKSVIGGALVIISALWQYGSKRKWQ